jgi:hypothetical protein
MRTSQFSSRKMFCGQRDRCSNPSQWIKHIPAAIPIAAVERAVGFQAAGDLPA